MFFIVEVVLPFQVLIRVALLPALALAADAACCSWSRLAERGSSSRIAEKESLRRIEEVEASPIRQPLQQRYNVYTPEPVD